MAKAKIVYYWYSERQATQATKYDGKVTSEVLVGTKYKKFSEITSRNKPSGLWSDYILVHKGIDCKVKRYNNITPTGTGVSIF